MEGKCCIESEIRGERIRGMEQGLWAEGKGRRGRGKEGIEGWESKRNSETGGKRNYELEKGT